MRYWQDIEPGERFQTDSAALSQEDIFEFATEFDPQPYHLDVEAGANSVFGGLCASGWQICAVTHRLILQVFKQQDIVLARLKVAPEIKWKKPIYPNQEFYAILEVTAKDSDSSTENAGEVHCDVQLLDAEQQLLMVMKASFLVYHSDATNKVSSTEVASG